MHRIHKAKLRRGALILAGLLMVTTLVACKRKPEELEVWRPSAAKNGQEKLVQWIPSQDELMETRIRATEILLEEDLAYAAHEALKNATDEDRQTIIEAVAPQVQQWCDAKDATLENYNAGKSKQVIGKDAAFQLYPLSKGGTQEKLGACILSWLSEGDYFDRDRMGNAKLLQIAEPLGAKAVDPLIAALGADARNPQTEIAKYLRGLKDPAVDKKATEALVKFARTQLPKIDADTSTALLETEHEAVVPFLVELVPDESVDGALRTTSVERIKKIKGKASLPIFLDWVEKHPGNLRWLAAQAIAESQGKAGLAPLMSRLPDNDKYGDGDPEGFMVEAQRFCLVEVKGSEKEPGIEGAAPILASQLRRGSVPARALALRCLQEVGSAQDAEAVQALTRSRDPLPAWGDTKTLGDLAKETLTKLK